MDKAATKIASLLTERGLRIASHGADDTRAAELLAALGKMGVVLDERRMTWKRPRRTFAEQVEEKAAAKGAANGTAKAAGAKVGGKGAAKGTAKAAGAKAGGKAGGKPGGKVGGKKDWRGYSHKKRAGAAAKKGAKEGPKPADASAPAA